MPIGREADADSGPSRRLGVDRVVEVYRPYDKGQVKTGTGTGYLLDDGLVLTAAHVVRGSRTADVRLAWRKKPVRCEVVWCRYDLPPGAGMDAALLRIVDSGFTPPRQPRVRWGKLVTAAGCPVEVIGFPTAMDFWSDERLKYRDVAHIRGEILPGSRLKARRYEIRVSTPVPPGPALKERTSRWLGMSGAGVCAGGLLVGVAEDSDPTGGALTAVPVDSLLADPGFRRLVGDVAAVPVELDDVLERPVALARSPIGLLRAEVATVRFDGRGDIVRGFLDWCRAPEEFALRLVTARAGEGKTRLAHELIGQLRRDGWCAGFLDPEVVGERSRVLTELTEPLFLVVDYAEGRPRQLEALIRLMERGSHHARPAPRVRLLLLARATGEWWDGLRSVTRILRSLPPDSVLPLPELQPSGSARLAAFRDAVADLHAGLATLPGYETGASVDLGQVVPPPLGHPRFGRALTIQMAALAELLQHVSPVDAARGEPDEEILIRHEARFWADTAPVHGLEHLHRATLRQLVAVVTLCPVTDAEQAMDLLGHLRLLSGETANTRTAVAAWLHELYAADGRYWDALVPDALGEYLVGRVGVEFGSLLDDLAGYVDRDQAEQMLTVLCGARTLFPALTDSVVRYVVSRPRPMAFAAVAVAVRGDHPVLTDALARLVAASTADAALIGDLLTDTPRNTIALARWAVRLATRLVELHGTEPGVGERALVALAKARHQLAFRLAQVGRHGEALEHAVEAVRLHREAVKRHGGELDGLADSLLVHAARLATLGRPDEAVQVVDEAVRLCRTLGHERGEQHNQARLAIALHHQAMWLHDIGEYAEAERIGAEAVGIRTRLADVSQHFHAPLAISSMNYACYLRDAGRPEDGLRYARAAVDAYRALTEESPDAHRVGLGRALTNLAGLLAALGDPVEALTWAEEAVRVYRQVVRVDTVEPLVEEFTVALANYGRRLAARGRTPEAIGAFTEAEELCLPLAMHGSSAVADRLATVRSDLRVLRRLDGEHPDAE